MTSIDGEIPRRLLLALTILALLSIPLVARALGEKEAVEEKQIYIIGSHDEADFIPEWVLPRDKYKLMTYVGIADWEQVYADELIHKESSWNPKAVNPYTKAMGLPQALTKTHKINRAEFTDPVTQMQWADNYVKTRYGNWKKALEFHKVGSCYVNIGTEENPVYRCGWY